MRNRLLGVGLACLLSVTFGHAQSDCQFSVSPVLINLDGAAQTGVVHVETQPGCAWSVTSLSVYADWLSLTAGAHTGSGDVSYSVSTMPSSTYAPRLRQIMIPIRWDTPTAGQNVVVTQAIGACLSTLYNLSRTPQTFGPLGGEWRQDVFAGGDDRSPWFVSSTPDWISTSPPVGLLGHDDGAVVYAIGPNPSTAPRDGTIRFCSGQSIPIHQAGISLRGGPFVPGDFDDDGIADLAIYRPSNASWYVRLSGKGYNSSDALIVGPATFNGPPSQTDTPIPGDFDGDGRTDLATYGDLPNIPFSPQAHWTVRFSANQYADARQPRSDSFEYERSIPLLADFNGDHMDDLVIYHPSTGKWTVTPMRTPPFTPIRQWGLPGDVPLPADYDGDGRADFAVWRPSNGTWYIRYSSTGYATAASFQWGWQGDVPVTGDFDADRRTDLAVWRPSEGRWYIVFSSNNYSYSTAVSYQWGLPEDVPVGNDFDGDGRTDLAVWRPSNGTWYLLFSSANYTQATARTYQWGLPGDVPLRPGLQVTAPNHGG